MPYLLIGLAFVIAIIDWIASVRDLKTLEYIAKPLVIVLLLLFLVVSGGLKFPLAWFTLGILFSLAGDVILMIPREKFILGLIAFLIAHLCYLAGLNTSQIPMNITTLLVVVIVFLGSFQIYRRLAASLLKSGKSSLRIPVLIYAVVISLMVLSAILTLVRPETEWKTLPAFLIAIGAVLFYLSDVILAWNKFVEPLPNGRFWNLSSYHLGQILIVLGAVLNF